MFEDAREPHLARFRPAASSAGNFKALNRPAVRREDKKTRDIVGLYIDAPVVSRVGRFDMVNTIGPSAH
jgi:hypothetical protein